MKHIELHILQSVPVACLNRDDLNSPKTAIFGGVQRARVSSQSWKKAIRDMAKEELPKFMASRTKRLVYEFAKRFIENGISNISAQILAEIISALLSKLDTKKDEAGYIKVKTLCFLSSNEFTTISEVVLVNEDVSKMIEDIDGLYNGRSHDDLSDAEKKILEKILKSGEKSISKKEIGNAIKGVKLKDAADIALFGRMIADDHSLAVEASSMFSHAISTHKVDNEIDFFTAVDDLQPDDEGGAAMMGSLEFNSATYYRFTALNLDMFRDEKHLAAMSVEERKKVVSSFVRSVLLAMPSARKNTMNANTVPGYVKVVIREKGHPIQLVNAFENPVVRKNDESLIEQSCKLLKTEYNDLKSTWGLDETEVIEFGKYAEGDKKVNTLDELLEKVKQYVE